MDKKIYTLNSLEDLIIYLKECSDILSYSEMLELVKDFTAGIELKVFTLPLGRPQDFEKPKQEIINWLEYNYNAIDNFEVLPMPFISTF